MLDKMNEEIIKEAIMIAQTSSILAALVFVMSSYRVTLKDIIVSCICAAICAPIAYYWLTIDGMTQFKASVVSSMLGAISSFIFTGIVKILFAFRKDPIKTARDLRK